MSHYEYRRRTMPIQRIKASALMLRETGITRVKEVIEEVSYDAANAATRYVSTAMRDYARHLIASMDYSVSQAQKELKRRIQK